MSRSSQARKRKASPVARQRSTEAQEVFVDKLVDVSQDVLRKVPAAERDRRIKNLSEYVSSLRATRSKRP